MPLSDKITHSAIKSGQYYKKLLLVKNFEEQHVDFDGLEVAARGEESLKKFHIS